MKAGAIIAGGLLTLAAVDSFGWPGLGITAGAALVVGAWLWGLYRSDPFEGVWADDPGPDRELRREITRADIDRAVKIAKERLRDAP